MHHYIWKGIDDKGKSRKGICDANSYKSLQAKLLNQHIALLSCHKQNNWSLPFLNIKSYSPVSVEQVTHFFEHLSMLLQCNIPIIESLKLSQNYVQSSRLQKIIQHLTKQIQEGSSLSTTMQQYKKNFTPLMISLTKSGEQSGNLGNALSQLARYLNIQISFTQKLKKAAVLPAITLIFAITIILGIFLFIIPQFEDLFNSSQYALPTSTKIILRISKTIQSEQFATGVVVVILMFIIAIKLLSKTKLVRKSTSLIYLHIPIVKRLVISANILTYTNTLSLLLRSGNTLQDALQSASNSMNNIVLREQTTKAVELVSKGKTLEETFKVINSTYIPESVLAAIALGEQTGNLDIMLEKTAQFLQKELSISAHLLTTIFQPILLLALGLLIGFLMLSIYLPIFNAAMTFS